MMKKCMKKMAAIMLAGCLVFSLGACGGGSKAPAQTAAESAADGNPAQTADFDARAYVEMLFAGDAGELTDTFGHEQALLDALEPSGGFEGLVAQLSVLGELKGTGEPIVSTIQGYTSYSVPCEFSVQNINLVINVNSENQVGGIFTAEYTGQSNGGETEASLPSGLVETELSVPVAERDGWELPGTLTLPEGDGPFPVVILVHGSGPQDRDETIGPNKPFQDLAWGLAKEGIAVFRYDKRTYVYQEEVISQLDLTLDDETVDDAVAAVSVMKNQPAIDASRIYVLGHSLGGEALPRINDALIQSSDGAAGYIFLAAPARKASVAMREQLDLIYSLSPALTKDQEAVKEQTYAQLDLLDDIEAQPDDTALLGAYAYYWKDLERYDPVAEAEAITQPCLVLQGEEDYQVTMEDFSLWETAFGDNENWTFKSFPGLTHLFMPGNKSNGSADYGVAQQVDSGVIDAIRVFVLE